MSELTLAAQAEAPIAPKQPETGAAKKEFVSITFKQWSAYDVGVYGEDFEGWANTFQLSATEAIKLRDALNGLNL